MKPHDNRPVLIVDDNPMNRMPIAAMLKKDGYSYMEAPGGREALDMVSSNEFSLIFMDLIMPGIDGFETIRRMRKMGVKTPIVAVSAMSFKQDMEDSRKAGCDAFLAKPAQFADIRHILEEWTGREHVFTTTNESDPESGTGEISEQDRAADFRGMTAVLVEADPVRKDSFRKILESMNLEVISISDGQKAWDMLESDSGVDIVISHLFTDGIDALGLLVRTRRYRPHVMFFIYTESYDAEVFQLAISHDVDGIIPVSQFEASIRGTMTAALWKHKRAETVQSGGDIGMQVRKAQSELIGYSCQAQCPFLDIAYASLGAAGGDIARCRRLNLHGRCGIVLADVAGHDVLSSYISAVFLGILMTRWDSCQQPGALIEALNRELLKTGYDKTHVCVTALLWDQLRGTIEIASAGNPGALVVRRDETGTLEFDHRPGGGMCLGLLPGTELAVHDRLALESGSDLFLFSDGIDEDELSDIIASEPMSVSGDIPLHESGRIILDRLSERRAIDDDMILLHLRRPSGKSQTEQGQDDPCHYAFRSSYDGVDQAILWAETRISPNDIPPDTDHDFIFPVIRELLLNAVEHGNRRDPDKWIDMSIFKGSGWLKVIISDEGNGFDLQKALDDPENREGLQIGKRGLPVIMSVADSIDVYGGSVTVIFGREGSCNP